MFHLDSDRAATEDTAAKTRMFELPVCDKDKTIHRPLFTLRCYRGREKKTFSWDWHAWNLVLVSTPAFLLGVYLHRVEKRMNEEAKLREEIQERTGVSSRGFLIPQRKIREEVQGMLSAGNQRAILAERDDVKATPAPATPRTVLEVCVLWALNRRTLCAVSVPYVLWCEALSRTGFRNIEETNPATSDVHSIVSS